MPRRAANAPPLDKARLLALLAEHPGATKRDLAKLTGLKGSDRIVLSSALADIPSERRGDVSEKLLQLNFVLAHHGGLTVAADGHDSKYHCLSSLVLAVLDARRFEAEVSGFIAKAKVAAELLELEGQAAQAAALQERLEPRSPDAQVILA